MQSERVIMILPFKILLGLSMIGLLITSVLFPYVGGLLVNHNVIKRGSTLAICRMIDHVISSKEGECRIYGIEQCALGLYRREIGRASCSMLELDGLRSTSPIGSITRRFTFNGDLGQYYSSQEYEAFIERYKRDPQVDYSVLLTFFCIFAVLVVGLTGYMVIECRKRRNDGYEEELVTK